MKRASIAQLSAVALALAMVLGAGGYSIGRGLTSDADKNVAPPPRGFRIIRPEGAVISWAIAVPDSPVPKGTRPLLWVLDYVAFRLSERETIRVQVDGPDGHTVSSLNSNLAVGKSLLVPMSDAPLNVSGRYVVTVFLLSESIDKGEYKVAEGDFTVSDSTLR